jgi:hypothetical protein
MSEEFEGPSPFRFERV